jgi:hypothetical protein
MRLTYRVHVCRNSLLVDRIEIDMSTGQATEEMGNPLMAMMVKAVAARPIPVEHLVDNTKFVRMPVIHYGTVQQAARDG